MALKYLNLDETTRKFMLQEVDLDFNSEKGLNMSRNFNEEGIRNWGDCLKTAIEMYDDAWLANQLRDNNYMKEYTERRKPKGGFTMAKVPVTAPEMFAEGEFNRFYARGLCLRAIEEGILNVIVYRAKDVAHSRPESEAKIGTSIDANVLLNDLRTSQGEDTERGIPGGPNSGLSIKLP
ncbi:MAG TPA: hypothetical protein PLK08_00800 [Phycisphaerae bacterium]|nr:hypothetical protein [Phycisphaerae bacterium]